TIATQNRMFAGVSVGSAFAKRAGRFMVRDVRTRNTGRGPYIYRISARCNSAACETLHTTREIAASRRQNRSALNFVRTRNVRGYPCKRETKIFASLITYRHSEPKRLKKTACGPPFK